MDKFLQKEKGCCIPLGVYIIIASQRKFIFLNERSP
jgi:hypothetical protein